MDRRRQRELDDLVARIHRVNPTERGLSKADTQRRYAEKSRLQSELVRRFPEQVVPVADPRQPGLVTLQMRVGRDAAHVPLDALDDEARAWVRRQLDTGREETPVPSWEAPRASAPDRPATALERGRAALAIYDFEVARVELSDALRETGGGSEAALALLELLVDTLAADDDALALLPRLGADASRHPGVRALLATAAARLDRGDLAGRLLEGHTGPRAAETALLMTRHALRRRAAAEARRWLARIRTASPAQSGLVTVEAAIDALEGEAHRGEEAALLMAADAPDPDVDDLERRALALQQLRPASPAVARALAVVRRRRNDEERAACLSRGAEALAAGRGEEALRLFRRAEALGADPAAFAESRAAAEVLAREAREQARIAALRASLTGSQSESALVEWWSAAAPDRVAARQGISWRALDDFEALAPEGAAAVKATARGVLALQAAREALEGGDHEAAGAHLDPHVRVLGDRAAGLLAEIEARRSERASSAVRSALQEAERALAGGGVDAAAARLAAVRTQVGPDDAAAFARLEAGVEVARAEATYAALLTAGDWAGARSLAERRREAGEPWIRRWHESDAALHAAMGFTVLDGDFDVSDVEVEAVDSEAEAWLSPTGDVVLETCHGAWVFLRFVRLGHSRAHRFVAFRDTGPVGSCVTSVEADGIRCLLGDRRVVYLTADGGRIRDVRDLPSVRTASELLEHGRLLGGYAWLGYSTRPTFTQRLVVVDLARGRVVRQIDDDFDCGALRDEGGCRGLVRPLRRAGSVHDAAGRRLVGLNVPDRAETRWALPIAGGWLVVAVAEDMLDWGDQPYQWWRLDAAGQPVARLEPLLGLCPDEIITVAPGRESRLAFLVVRTESAFELMALPEPAPSPRLAWRLPLQGPVCLLRDADGRQVVAVATGPDGLRSTRLGSDPPEFDAAPDAPRDPGPMRDWFECSVDLTGVHDQTRQFEAELRRRGPRAEAWLLEMVADSGTSALSTIALYRATQAQRPEHAERVLEAALQRFPRDPTLTVMRAEEVARAGDWTLAAGLSSASWATDPRVARHLAHLRGLGRLHGGDFAGAIEEWVGAPAALESAGRSCELDELIRFARVGLGGRNAPPPVSRSERLVRGIVEADRALRRGEFWAVIEGLDCRNTWTFPEIQSLARLASAWLAMTPGDTAGLARKRLTLAAYVAAFEDKTDRRNLPVPGKGWGRAKLAGLSREAGAWLSGG